MPSVRTNDVETYYERRGSGPPVVFVHGAILDHGQSAPQVEALADEYTAIAYDVRGHGRTGGSSRTAYSIDLLAADLDALITALDLDRPVVVGHSTGGCIAQVYAADHPDRIRGVVLADTFSPDVFTRGEWFQRAILLRATIPPTKLIGYERVEKLMLWLQERVQGEGVSGDYERIEQLREDGPKMTTDEFAKVIGAIVGFHHTAVDLSAIDVPALVLYGENEPAFVRRHAEHFGEQLPNVSAVDAVPDAGHASNLDNPEFFTDALREFLQEVFEPDAGEAGGAEAS